MLERFCGTAGEDHVVTKVRLVEQRALLLATQWHCRELSRQLLGPARQLSFSIQTPVA